MVSPQCKNGYTKIANEILEALAKIRIDGCARQILDCVLRKSYGYNRKTAKFKSGELSKMTGIDRRNIPKQVSKLIAMNIISVIPQDDVILQDDGPEIRFEKNYEKWGRHPTRRRSVIPQDDTRHPTRRRTPIIKKNLKKERKYTASPCDAANTDGIDFLTTKKGRKLSGKRWQTFKQFWDAFDYKKGKREAADAWYDIPSLTNDLVTQIIDAAKREAKDRSGLKSKGLIPKMAQGWISGYRWEDENNQSKLEAAKIAEEKKAFEKQIEQQMKRREEFLKNNPDYYEEKKYDKKKRV